MVEDAAVAYVMTRCQMVLCGAEAVLESGGVINKTGTLSASDDLADRMPF
jgi:translation initiation factor eIF-2B subunit alpha